MTWKFLVVPIVISSVPKPDPIGLSYPALNVAADFSSAESDVEGYVKRGKFFSTLRNKIRTENSTLATDAESIKSLISAARKVLRPRPSSFAEVSPDFPSITVTLVDDVGDLKDTPVILLQRFNASRATHVNDFQLCVQILQAQVEKLKVLVDMFNRERMRPSFLQMSNITQIGPVGAATQSAKIAQLIGRVNKGGKLAYQAMTTLLDYSNDQVSLELMKSMQLPMMLNKLLIDPKSRLSGEAQRLAASLRVKITSLPSLTVRPGKGGGYGNVVMVLPRPSRVYAKDELS